MRLPGSFEDRGFMTSDNERDERPGTVPAGESGMPGEAAKRRRRRRGVILRAAAAGAPIRACLCRNPRHGLALRALPSQPR